MRRRSLKLRLLVAATVSVAAALAAAGAGLSVLFEQHVMRRLEAELETHLRQLAAGVEIAPDGTLSVSRGPADPRFSEPLSGLYWQIESERGAPLRSRSLWDTTLALPRDRLGKGGVHVHELAGPGGTRVMLVEREIMLAADGKSRAVRLAVAEDARTVASATRAFAADLVPYLVVLGAALVAAAWVQVGVGLRPFASIRRSVAAIRSGAAAQLPNSVPREVAPLVDEVNALLAERAREIERSRNRAADLAHGLKTPLTALAADARRLRETGETAIAGQIEAVGELMRRHIDHELTRARIRGVQRGGPALRTPLLPPTQSLVETLRRTPMGERIAIDIDVAAKTMIAMDREDLTEALGNLLENAVRHARARVRVTARSAPGAVEIDVEDDGPGVPEERRAAIMERGTRLDEAGPGGGLGLAIVKDVLEAYGGTLSLGRAELGGLRARLRVPDPGAA
ncbi:MAG TPA: HAMP domain-containing sensor histidine kinase [Alphaproteobacteria bacterium]|jgi:signal transduction histidine kinase